MKRVLPIALAAPLILIGAAHPDLGKADIPMNATTESASAPTTYRPCRPGRGDDRCIQLYERGVRASYARWLGRESAPAERTQVAAVGGPSESAAPPPPPARHREETRCDHEDDGAHHGETRGM